MAGKMPKHKAATQRRMQFSERILRTLRMRELGHRSPLGTQAQFSSALYTTILPCNYWDQTSGSCASVHGGVFNLEFSPEGSLLVAACERRSILMFDPLCRKLIRSVDDAHEDCVNCVRFLDSRTFATCSDDTTVALWDARNLKQKIRTLRGHSNWVKNIEYSRRDGLLVTSGFDGSIYTWDINSYTEEGLVYNRVFHTNGLMRTRLNPDGSKMVICTTGGYLMIIHDLDLSALNQDLAGFKPNMYRLMQLSQTSIPVVAIYTHLFNAKRNRVEFITDFPEGNDAEVISSLQVHPQGWCVLSRNTSGDENSEWTCVHDIQDVPSDTKALETSEAASPDAPQSEWSSNFDAASDSTPPPSNSGYGGAIRTSVIFPGTRNQILRPLVQLRFNMDSDAPPPPPRQTPVSVEVHYASPTVFEALDAIREARVRQVATTDTPAAPQTPPTSSQGPSPNSPGNGDGRNAYFIRTGSHVSARTVLLLGTNGASGASPTAGPSHRRAPMHRIHQNSPRLLGYAEEPNVGRGFIKELCFSSDGRLIFSPFENGVRIMAFDRDGSELSECVPDQPMRLHDVARNFCHGNVVVSTKFSPTHCLLVSGCLNGKIVWHQPLIL